MSTARLSLQHGRVRQWHHSAKAHRSAPAGHLVTARDPVAGVCMGSMQAASRCLPASTAPQGLQCQQHDLARSLRGKRPHAVCYAEPPKPACANASSQRQASQHQESSSSSSSSATTHSHIPLSRRSTLLCTAAGLVAMSWVEPWTPGAAHASKLPAFADRAWEALGGGPADLTFPDAFLGVWDVTSVLTQVDLPLGEGMVQDLQVVKRAQQEDLNQPVRYKVAFVRNAEGRVVFDRAFNTAALLSYYYGRPATDFLTRIEWNIRDPNVLQLTMPGGLFIRTRVTRRSEELPGPDRIETSEYMEQVFDSSETAESSGPAPRLKASQTFTKYRFREERGLPSGQPAIVATQVVSDYLDPRTDDPRAIQALNRPVTLYTYRMAFTRAAQPAAAAAATAAATSGSATL